MISNTAPSCPTLQQSELIQILHTPSFLLSGVERELGHTPLYWSFDSAAEGLQVREIGSSDLPLGFRTAPLVGRFDLSPSLSMPLQWQGWSIRPELTLRNTFYTQRFDPTLAASTGKAQDDVVKPAGFIRRFQGDDNAAIGHNTRFKPIFVA